MRELTANQEIFKSASQSDADPFDFVLSDESVDRDGDIVRADGWKLSDFRKNPVALFGHDHKNVVGVWTQVRIEGKRLLGRLKFADQGTSEFIDTARSLVEQRILKAVSVGFMPLEYEPRNAEEPWKGFDITKASLLEASLVAVPANPHALSLAKALCSPDVASKLFVRPDSAEATTPKHNTLNVRVDSDFKTPNLDAARERAKKLGIDI